MKILLVDVSGGNSSFNLYSTYLTKAGIKNVLVIDKKRKNLNKDISWQKQEQDNSKGFSFPFYKSFNFSSINNFKKFIQFSKKFDLIVCTGISPIWMRFTKKPFVFYATGYELDDIANYHPCLKLANSKLKHLEFYIARYLIRTSLKKSIAGVVAPYQVDTATKLGIKNLKFLPHFIDANFFKELATRKKEKDKAKKKLECDLIFFHPSGHEWTNKNFRRYKGNDKLIKAIADYLKSTKKKVKLIMVERGNDVTESKKLIKRLGIEKNVIWLGNINNSSKIKYYYNIADVVLDQFGAGILARVAIEALACGCPVVSNIENKKNNFFYSEYPPILKVNNKERIVKMLHKLEKEDYKNKIAKISRRWIVRNCHWPNSIKKHILFYENLINKY